MSSRLTRLAWLGLALLWAAPLGAAGLRWEAYRRPAPTPRLESAMVYDSVRQRYVMFGGYEGNFNRDGEIWEYEPVSASWTEVTPKAGLQPGARNGAAMAYDPLRQRIFLFGGQNSMGHALGDTWQWDCVAKAWLEIETPLQPSNRWGSSLVHAGGADGLLLFGGGYQNDTWAFDLATREWSLVPTTFSSPSGLPMRPRSYHAAAVSPATQRLVIFGGIDGSAGGVAIDLDDMWELRGSVWTEVSPALRPPAAGWLAMAFDELGRLVLHGGWTNAGEHSYADTWVTTWNGSVWANWQRIALPPAPSPGIRDSHVMVADPLRHKILLFGGYLTDLWEFAAGAWVPAAPRWDPSVSQEVYAPAKHAGHAMAYDSLRNHVLMFGAGSIEMWRFDLATRLWFIEGNQAPMPITRRNHAMAYDAARDRTILFGGECERDPWGIWNEQCPLYGGVQPPGTWAWNAATRTWADVSPAVAPSPRSGHAMAYDAERGRVVLFGGYRLTVTGEQVPFDDTWLWDGVAWSQAGALLRHPSARSGHAMAWDAVRRRIVLFGGGTGGFGSGTKNDTWEWDGARWTQATPQGPLPAPRSRPTLIPLADGQGGVLLMGGYGNDASLGDAWLWNGTNWSGVAPLGRAPSGRSAPAAVAAAAAGRIVLYGGADGSPYTLPSEVWLGQLDRSERSLTASDCYGKEAGLVPCRVDFVLDPPAAQATSVSLAPIDGLARLGFDYGPLPPTVVFPAGVATRTLDVPVLGDPLYEGDESFSLDLAVPSGVALVRQRLTGTIADDDPKPVLTIAACSVTEGNLGTVPLPVEVTLTGPAERPTPVSGYTTGGGSALGSLDYGSPPDAELVFPGGLRPRTLSFQVPVYGDREVETTETVRVRAFGSQTAGGVVRDCTIQDDDVHPWKLIGAGAFDVDSSPDLLWRHDLTGELRVWLMNGLQRVADVPLTPAANTDFTLRPRALADLDGNGTSDIFWNQYYGDDLVWLMNGTTRASEVELWQKLGYNGPLAAVADFGPAPSGGAPDGRHEIVRRQRWSGVTTLGFLDDRMLETSVATVDHHPQPGWDLVGAADLGRSRSSEPDGRPDLLWRRPDTGRLVVWIMEGPYRKRGFFTTPMAEPDLDWRPAGLADVDHDGKTDILWQNDATHALRVWLMDGGTRLSSLPLDPATGP